MQRLSNLTVLEMLTKCSAYVEGLVANGVDEQVALDRTWDAYESAYMGLERPCFDPRDRAFESKLREIAARG